VRICFYLILRLKEMLMGLEEIQWFGGIHSGMLAAEFGEMIQQGNVAWCIFGPKM